MTTIGPINALGTVWYVECFAECDQFEIKQVVSSWLEAFEVRYSRFKDSSILCELNRTGQILNPESELVDLLKQSLQAYQVTDGVFNIAVGERMEKIGYDRTYSLKTHGDVSAPPALPAVLAVTDTAVTLMGGKLDLGGIGKGYAIDQLALVLREQCDSQHFLINGGGDMYATSEQGKPIEVTLQHPLQPDQRIGSVWLRGQGFAASSPFVRAWVDKETGEERNHLHSTNQIASYVVAPTTTEADVWATTLSLVPDTLYPDHLQALLLQNESILRVDPIFRLH